MKNFICQEHMQTIKKGESSAHPSSPPYLVIVQPSASLSALMIRTPTRPRPDLVTTWPRMTVIPPPYLVIV
jgi:hypothetical protein